MALKASCFCLLHSTHISHKFGILCAMYRHLQDRYEIEEIGKDYEPFIKEIVFQAIYVHAGQPAPTRDILKSPDLSKYYKQWGRNNDHGLVAIHQPSETPVGGAFVRYYQQHEAGYGFVSEKYPELNIALLPDHRSKGLGSKLMQRLIEDLREKGCPGISLSVDLRNHAYEFYRKLGFKTVSLQGNPTMLLLLD